ncbi:MAG: bifunctional histidinol-phosphatase/imidazoleglycerol-phosphate dehydratase HisB [Chromatiales bacterium]|jgi:imidazoleglycerol-phosphate dehydratase/histidinol-phosphatase|nr:bifunctional histidinol-phosphatase/imidazoleglycerol-phosphate dehydratase HisB [Chromatiales bacterium]
MTAARIAFLDRDGTLIWEPPDEQVDRLDKVELVPGVIPALLRLRDAGYQFVMVTNQDGLGTESFPTEDFQRVQDFVVGLFRSQGIVFRDVFICPHRPADACDCRKPKPGILGDFLQHTPIDTAASFVAGDRETDLEFARNIGVRAFRIRPADAGSWPEVVRALLEPERTATVQRETKETRIRISVNLDATGPVAIRTGIGFFDHMLEQVAKHGGFALEVDCAGDLHVDEHHTVEDVALALGQALREALGDKRGIGRYGFLLPMDESEAKVSLDLSGRPYLVFRGRFPRPAVGGLPTELVPHFFRSLADTLGANLHIAVRGDNSHHMVEACFKGVGRTLRQAIARHGDVLPSTKGVL